VLVNSKVYIAAEKYDIQLLRLLAAAKDKAAVATLWNSLTFSESTHLIYSNAIEPDKNLRNVIAQIKERIKALLEKGEFMTVLKDHGNLSLDVIRKMVGIMNV